MREIAEVWSPAFLLSGVLVVRWALRASYGRSVLRQMRRRSRAAGDAIPVSAPHGEAEIRFQEVRSASEAAAARAAVGRRAARRQWVGRCVALFAAVLAQFAALVVFGGVPLIENPSEPWVKILLSQAQLLAGSGFFLLAILAPGLIRSGQTSAVAWWLFAAPPGMLAGVVPYLLLDPGNQTLLGFGLVLTMCIALGYAMLTGALAAALFLRRVLRLSPEGLGFVIAGSIGAACNAAVLKLESGATVSWWVVFAAAEALILAAPYVLGLWTRPREAPVRLLFLRNFGNRSRSDRLLHEVCRTWLALGEIHLIVGPDVAASTASPDGVLRFATLRMRRHFVRSPEDVDRRFGAPSRPSLDGRYEAHEYPCFDDTWRPAIQRLAARVHVILVDVRGYSSAHGGTAFELATLGQMQALDRTVLIVDDATPLDPVRAAIALGGVGGTAGILRVSNRKDRRQIVPLLLSAGAARAAHGVYET